MKNWIARILLGLIGLSAILGSLTFVFAQEVADPVTTTSAQPSSDNGMPPLTNAAAPEATVSPPNSAAPILKKDTSKKTDEIDLSQEKLLSSPFEQLKNIEGPETGEKGKDADEEGNPQIKEVEMPSLIEQEHIEYQLQQKLEGLLKTSLGDKYVNVAVATHYVIHTAPITRGQKQISKVKLPGFGDHVWVPTESKKILGLVNQVRRYASIFVVVSKPISKFDYEVVRQTLIEKVQEVDLQNQDILKMVYVPLAERKEEPVPLPPVPIAKESKEDARKIEFDASKQLLEARKSYFENDMKSALNKIQKAIEINPKSAQAYAMLGSVYYRLNWNALAKTHWKKSLEIEPNNPLIVQYLERLEEQ